MKKQSGSLAEKEQAGSPKAALKPVRRQGLPPSAG